MNKIVYEDVTYEVGMRIVGTAESEYECLYGVITKIRDGEENDTDNETPDIYCCFEQPVLPCGIQKLEERFSILYAEPKKLEDIILDAVIMAPDMIEPVG